MANAYGRVKRKNSLLSPTYSPILSAKPSQKMNKSILPERGSARNILKKKTHLATAAKSQLTHSAEFLSLRIKMTTEKWAKTQSKNYIAIFTPLTKPGNFWLCIFCALNMTFLAFCLLVCVCVLVVLRYPNFKEPLILLFFQLNTLLTVSEVKATWASESWAQR